jgi:hypothetical protein
LACDPYPIGASAYFELNATSADIDPQARKIMRQAATAANFKVLSYAVVTHTSQLAIVSSYCIVTLPFIALCGLAIEGAHERPER